ncbi:MAG: VOC family protein [Rhizobiales bacterium]|nr:VOC family protein [Hyphomicrobiales bacterium]
MTVTTQLAQKIFQIGYVVPDLHAAIRFFKETLGVPDFMVWENLMLEQQTYNGTPGDYVQSIAFGYAGDMQIELIQPLSGESTYSAYLRQNPKGGVQHLGILVDDFDAAVKAMTARGFKIVQSGCHGDTRLVYLDTGDASGTLTEIITITPEEQAMFARFKRGEWTGRQ